MLFIFNELNLQTQTNAQTFATLNGKVSQIKERQMKMALRQGCAGLHDCSAARHFNYSMGITVKTQLKSAKH